MEHGALADQDLLVLTRGGDMTAFAEIWRRYEGWARHLARTTTTRLDDADIASEAFTKILHALCAGKGPVSGFAAYLAATVRNIAATWGARQSRQPTVPLGDVEIPVDVDWTVPGDLGDLTLPFAELPERYKEVLWLTTVLGFSLAEAAAVMDTTPGAAAVTASRARAALRRRMDAAHAAIAPAA